MTQQIDAGTVCIKGDKKRDGREAWTTEREKKRKGFKLVEVERWWRTKGRRWFQQARAK